MSSLNSLTDVTTESASLVVDPRRARFGLADIEEDGRESGGCEVCGVGKAGVEVLGVRLCFTCIRLFFPIACTSKEPRFVLIP
jgi:hypothetical protein